MADWKETYLAALDARDEVEKAYQDIYDAYTRLVDRTTQLSRPAAPPPSTPQEPAKSPPPPSLVGRFSTRSPTPALPPADSSSTIALRQEFAVTQAERAKLSAQLDSVQAELDTLKASSKSDRKEITRLTKTCTQVQLRLRDRDEELRGKAKLVEDVQDENVTLNLELKQADEKARRLKRENQELVDRWMKSKGEEAERMNSEGKFG